jgi:hypothetical protein
MNLVYYNDSIILVMTSAMERPIKVDKRLLNVDRGRFIRICVKIDLSLPVVGKFASLRKETCFDSNLNQKIILSNNEKPVRLGYFQDFYMGSGFGTPPKKWHKKQARREGESSKLLIYKVKPSTLAND